MKKQLYIAVEDALSEVVLRKLLSESKGNPQICASFPVRKGWQDDVGKSGYGYIKKELPKFNKVASTIPFVVLVDADNRPCPSETIKDWLNGAKQNSGLIVRVAMREVEAWLLSDRSGIADYLAVPVTCIPQDPSRLKDPKRYLSRLAARSKRKEVRADLARQPGTRSKAGPYFNQALMAFVKNLWDLKEASKNSESLRRAIAALDKL